MSELCSKTNVNKEVAKIGMDSQLDLNSESFGSFGGSCFQNF
jgi:hypothetical protein